LSKALDTGERVILAPHHVSFIDPLLFSLFSPGEPLAVISPSMTQRPWFRLFKSAFNYVVIDQNDPKAADQINDLWKKTNYLILFPEPEPTTTGLVMKVTDAAASAIENSGAWIVTAVAGNMQFTPFSRMMDRLTKVLAPKVTLIAGEAWKIGDYIAEVSGGTYSAKRAMGSMLNDTKMLSLWDRKPLFDTVLEQRKLWGGSRVMAIEPGSVRTNWNRFVTLVMVMRRIVLSLAKPNDRVGIMMPNTVATLAMLIGVQRADMEPAMMNYSMGPRHLKGACDTAKVGLIITSKRFVDAGNLHGLVDAMVSGGITVKFIEDLVSGLTMFQKLGAALSAKFARATPDPEKYAERNALVLFTSGSEGSPKAVALSHLNVQANTAQVRCVLDFFKTDVILGIMPMFHSFGLCTGTIMPLSAGITIAFYPTPLHYKKIPQYSYETKGTILVGSNAFLSGYARSAEQFDFVELRYVIGGGDKLKESTAKLWYEKFGTFVMEGYGVTECAPVVSVNKKGHNKPGSIGMPLAGIRTSITPVEGVAEGGRLIVRGPNVMKGYIMEDGSINPPPDTGYDTGDIVTIDDEGFITIIGRAKRFAKIGGEMISLAFVEEAVQAIWPDEPHAVVSVSGDESKGEILVLLSERQNADREELRAALTDHGLSELAIPKKVIVVETLPRIGVGKVDYQAAAKIAAGE
ncbi:MAG: AMP-binding protein, partial [Synergistaceae bacterium]|nr:AMP-binding protein [Synergistaceae bacterium]